MSITNLSSSITSTLAEFGLLDKLIFRAVPGVVEGEHSDALFMFILWVSVFFFVLLMALMVLFVIKYRRRPGTHAPVSAAHNTPLEIAWTVIPSATLVVMFFSGFKGYVAKSVAPSDAVQMHLTAKMWNWSVTYPNGVQSITTTTTSEGGPVDVPIFYFPAGKPVKLLMTSQDVIHSFWVPDFRKKFDVFPNRNTTFWFQPEDLSPEDLARGHRDHWVFCAEYCGTDHSEMAAIIRIVPMRTFVQWLQNAGSDRPLPPLQLGAALYKAKGCASCHTVDGSASTGPTWKNLYGYEQEITGGPTVIADENYIRESIYVPAAKVVKGYPNQMSPYAGQINEEQLAALIVYMQSLSDRGPKQDFDEVSQPANENGAEGADTPPVSESH
ncbi:MAG: cytochrome c oxidase subunit II [Phycisphaerales bacterium]|jgi:cytochrome c oxidase subunit 2|nr:cytochrome c oxidase subunit II [Phycisphaerales bacterium]